MKLAVISFLLMLLSSCASVLQFPWTDSGAGEPSVAEAEAAPEAQVPAPAPAPTPTQVPTKGKAVIAPADLELKIAQLWNRVDELETQVLQQKERSKLLEKGLLLGIVPDELKDTIDPQPKRKLQAEQAPREVPQDGVMSLSAKAPVKHGPRSSDVDSYRSLLQEAQSSFNNANYGKAITLYSEIGERFEDSLTEGSQLYWMGLSWFYLKEYKLAEQTLGTFRERYPHNPWVPHAGFYSAKIDQSRGLNQRAMEQFQKILDEFPDRDLGEMAKMEIQSMREKL